jgi:hypothetical protein
MNGINFGYAGIACGLALLIICMLMLSCVPHFLRVRKIPFRNYTDTPDSLLEITNTGTLYAERKVWSLFDGWKYQNHGYGHDLKYLRLINGEMETKRFLFFAPLLGVYNKQFTGQISIEAGSHIHTISYDNESWYTGMPELNDPAVGYPLEAGVVLQPAHCKIILREELRAKLIPDHTDPHLIKAYELFVSVEGKIGNIEYSLPGSALSMICSATDQLFSADRLLPMALSGVQTPQYTLCVFLNNDPNDIVKIPLEHLKGHTYTIKNPEDEKHLINQLLYGFAVHQELPMVKKIIESGEMAIPETLIDDLLVKVISVGWDIRGQSNFKTRNTALAQYLINKGANINQLSDSDEPLIFRAAMFGCDSTVQLFIAHGASLNLDLKKYSHFLEYAVNWNNDWLLDTLLDAGIDLPAQLTLQLQEKLKARNKM